MADVFFNIDDKEIVAFTSKLKQMHKSDFPIAVRKTLDDNAFYVKNLTLMHSAKRVFTLRNTKFLSKYSGVIKASGFDVNTMESKVEIISSDKKFTKGMKTQEYGGTRERQSIYLDKVRQGKSNKGLVKKEHQLDFTEKEFYLNASQYVSDNGFGKKIHRTRGSNFIAQAWVALREDKMILWKTSSTEGTVFKVKNFRKTKKGKPKILTIPIADYKKNNTVRFRERKFWEPAAMRSFEKTHQFFIKNAEKRFERDLKK
jgi:hypothetical protein